MDALLIIDMLNDFVEEWGALYVPQAKRIIPAIKKKLDEARKKGIPVFFICDAHKPDDPEFRYWPRHAIDGEKGAAIIKELRPQEGEYIIKKVSYSGFFRTELERRLREHGVKRLILTGVLTNICVLYTGVDALMRGYEVEVDPDAVAALTDEDHRFALRQLKEVLKPR
ncbi:cysteine hydrolase [candidate division WOR-3 bacterium]|uniref:Cysteine hydrolase n=1 Tax=candidate division WOR-3 bacterium TaxID=2052148 RepID=A0A660SG03_UNCW3|nr:MAG: cysteine hydrolase [candidate division WOR-3 bacterium]